MSANREVEQYHAAVSVIYLAALVAFFACDRLWFGTTPVPRCLFTWCSGVSLWVRPSTGGIASQAAVALSCSAILWPSRPFAKPRGHENDVATGAAPDHSRLDLPDLRLRARLRRLED